MDLISWSDTLSTGIAEQDEQHQNLIELINRLNAAKQAGRDAEILAAVLAELVDYTIYHFQYEENLMHQHDYADTQAHKSEHKRFIEAVDDFTRNIESGNGVISVQIMNFLRMWISGHIMITDKRMAEELSRFGVK